MPHRSVELAHMRAAIVWVLQWASVIHLVRVGPNSRINGNKGSAVVVVVAHCAHRAAFQTIWKFSLQQIENVWVFTIKKQVPDIVFFPNITGICYNGSHL